jgi:glyoxylase-like metal-dependent hydrolase (beta-lactamase superfamily II)
MSEPETIAETIEKVLPGVWRWHVQDERIGAESDAHAVQDVAGTVLIDPLPLRPAALERLHPIVAICLTAACHQRSAWRYRREYGVKVYAPEGARATDEEPDVRYRADELLPGGLKAIHTPGPEHAHYAFWREPSPGVLFCPDLIMRDAGGALAFMPAEYHDDPEATRDSVRRLLDLAFDVLCLDHGAPITADPHAALRTLFE